MRILDLKNNLLERMTFISNELDKRDSFDLTFNGQKEATKNTEKFYIFLSEFGQEFEDNYQDLSDYFSLPFIVGYLFKVIREEPLDYFVSEDFAQPLSQYLRNLEGEKKPKDRELRKAKRWFKKIRKMQKNAKESNDTKEEINDDIVKEMKILARETAYFIFSLYAYIDFYCTTLVEYIQNDEELKNNKEIHRISSFRYNPHEKIKTILKQTKIDDVPLSKLCIDFIAENDLGDTLRSFSEIIKIRHPIAHKSPIIDFTELRRKFPKQYNTANKKKEGFHKFKIKIEEEEELSFLKEAYEKFVEPIGELIETLFFIKEVGKSAVRYLSLIDSLIFLFFNDF